MFDNQPNLSGYLSVYVSNESAQEAFFDNLNIQYKRGPLLEESHYYPFRGEVLSIDSKTIIH